LQVFIFDEVADLVNAVCACYSLVTHDNI